MEILEKLPGVTVERELLIQGSYTWTPDPARLRRQRSALSKSHQPKMPPESLRNSVAINRSKLHSNQSYHKKPQLLADTRSFRRAYSISQCHQFTDNGKKAEQLQILGKNPQNTLKEITSKKEAAQIKTTDCDTLRQSPVILKSILKRSGSVLSSKSCSTIEVMSLDSGMSKLAASLSAQKHSTKISNKWFQVSNSKSPKPPKIEESKQVKSFSQDDIANQTKKNNLESEQNSKQEFSTGTTQSKTVSFKLDPEMQRKEKERLLTRGKLRGETNRGVAILSYKAKMPEKRTKTPCRMEFGTCWKKEMNRYHLKSSTHAFNYYKDKEKKSTQQDATLFSKHFVSNVKSSATNLHPYLETSRKFFMNRALEETQRVAKENYNSTTISLRNYLAAAAAAASSFANNSNKAINNTALDKSYMSMSHAFYNKKGTFLPVIQSQDK